jgi:hypothetical protein
MPAAPTPPRPVSLSDEAMLFVMRVTEPLHPNDRSAFLKTLATRLRGEAELGDGVIFRVAREVLRSGFFKPPKIDRPTPKMLQREAAPILED